jgi:hypothetical protein
VNRVRRITLEALATLAIVFAQTGAERAASGQAPVASAAASGTAASPVASAASKPPLPTTIANILGVSTGMALEEAVSRLKRYNASFKVTMSADGRSAHLEATGAPETVSGVTLNTAESFDLQATPRPPHTVYSVSRQMDRFIVPDDILAELATKYGPIWSHRMVAGDTDINGNFWTFNDTGHLGTIGCNGKCPGTEYINATFARYSNGVPSRCTIDLVSLTGQDRARKEQAALNAEKAQREQEEQKKKQAEQNNQVREYKAPQL